MFHKTMRYRRRQDRLHKRRLREIAKYGSYPGPWIRERDGRLVESDRGSISKYLKALGNRKIRRVKHDILETAPRGGWYKKVFDYWWSLT